MFSLSGATKFKYIPNYKDMRGGYDKLRGVVSALDGRMEEGTAYVFTSRNQKLVKIIRHEHNECQLYMQKYDCDETWVWTKVKSKKVKASSKLVHALDYMRNNWTELIAYRDIGSVLIDNNCCERAVRPFTNLRKSFGGFSSEKGGEVAAAWLTFIETCKLQKKAAFDFFNDFFKKVTEGRSDYELITQEVLS